MRNLKRLETQLTEDKCLDEALRLQQGSDPCKACGERAGWRPASKHRSFACRSCGFQIYPLLNTPFARPLPTLRDWFLTTYLCAGQEPVKARDLRLALGVDPKVAEELAGGVERLKAARDTTAKGEEWFDAIREFTEGEADKLPAAAPEPPKDPIVARALASAETRWHYAGIGAIVGLALLAAGIGWVLVPETPEEDTELVQATAILSLAEDRPVILVSAEVAEQLYDVSDDDSDEPSPLLPSIRLAPASGATDQAAVAEAKPLARPSIKLSTTAGQSLLKGDLSSLKGKGGDRPELAVYSALARELEGGGSRNPDELLTFGPMKIRRHLVEKVYRAARTVRMDPVLLMAIADKESAFATEVQAKTSSATGLFQFIERTWLGVVRDFGPTYGLVAEAKLVQSASLAVAERTRILDLRRDAYLSAVFAAEMLKRDALRIQKKLGRDLSGGEIYLIHFLGPAGAEQLIERVKVAPTVAAADILPKPAEANKTIFYAKGEDGAAKQVSVSELKDKFDTMIKVRLDRYRPLNETPGAKPPAQKPR